MLMGGTQGRTGGPVPKVALLQIRRLSFFLYTSSATDQSGSTLGRAGQAHNTL